MAHWRLDKGAPKRRIAGHSVTYCEDLGCCYIYGGSGSDKNSRHERKQGETCWFDTVWSLSLNNLMWSPVECPPGNYPPSRERHSTVLWKHEERRRRGKDYEWCYDLIVFGGVGDTVCFNDCWSFDVEQAKWTHRRIGDHVRARHGHTAVAVLDDMLVFGGNMAPKTDGIVPLGDFHRYCIREDRWEKLDCKGNPPSPRTDHHCCVHGKHMYIFGGQDRVQTFNDLWSWSFTSCRWKRIETEQPPLPLSGCMQVVDTVTGEMLLWGGKSEEGAYSRALVAYSFKDKHWIHYHNEDETTHEDSNTFYPTSRSKAPGVLHEGELFLFGGIKTKKGKARKLFTLAPWIINWATFKMSRSCERRILNDDYAGPIAKPSDEYKDFEEDDDWFPIRYDRRSPTPEATPTLTTATNWREVDEETIAPYSAPNTLDGHHHHHHHPYNVDTPLTHQQPPPPPPPPAAAAVAALPATTDGRYQLGQTGTPPPHSCPPATTPLPQHNYATTTTPPKPTPPTDLVASLRDNIRKSKERLEELQRKCSGCLHVQIEQLERDKLFLKAQLTAVDRNIHHLKTIKEHNDQYQKKIEESVTMNLKTHQLLLHFDAFLKSCDAEMSDWQTTSNYHLPISQESIAQQKATGATFFYGTPSALPAGVSADQVSDGVRDALHRIQQVSQGISNQYAEQLKWMDDVRAYLCTQDKQVQHNRDVMANVKTTFDKYGRSVTTHISEQHRIFNQLGEWEEALSKLGG